MICEYCNKPHNGSYASGRFCSETCSRLFSIKKNSEKEKIKEVECNNCHNIFQVKRGTAKKFYVCHKCKDLYYGSRKRVYKRTFVKLICYQCNKEFQGHVPTPEISRYCKKAICKECKSLNNKKSKQCDLSKPWEEWSRNAKRKQILKEQDNKCLICHIDSWNEKPIKFHLDHMDGNRNNNSKENLRLICPNCHSQTDTYCRGIYKNRKLSDEEIIFALKQSNSISGATRLLAIAPSNHYRISRLWKKLQESVSSSG
jgi:hypothetical protein